MNTRILPLLALGLTCTLSVHAQSDGSSHGNAHDDRMAQQQMLHTPCTSDVSSSTRAYISISGGSGNSTRSGGVVECNPKLAPVSPTAYGPTGATTTSSGGYTAGGKAELNRINALGYQGGGSGHYGN